MERVTVGVLLVATGLLHQLVGLYIAIAAPPPIPAGRSPLREVLEGGLIGAVEPDPWRMTMFWYFAFGMLLLLVGALAHHVEGLGRALPRWFGWSLAALGLGGGLLIPVSGFWLVLPQAWLVLRRAPRAAPATA